MCWLEAAVNPSSKPRGTVAVDENARFYALIELFKVVEHGCYISVLSGCGKGECSVCMRVKLPVDDVDVIRRHGNELLGIAWVSGIAHSDGDLSSENRKQGGRRLDGHHLGRQVLPYIADQHHAVLGMAIVKGVGLGRLGVGQNYSWKVQFSVRPEILGPDEDFGRRCHMEMVNASADIGREKSGTIRKIMS